MSFTQEQLIEAIESAFAKLQPKFLAAITEELAKLIEVSEDNGSDDTSVADTESGSGEEQPEDEEEQPEAKACPVKAKAAAAKKVAEMKKKAGKKKTSPKTTGKSEVVAKIVKSLSTATAQKMDKAYYNVDSKRAIGESKTNIGKYTYYSAEKIIGELEEGEYIEEVDGMGKLYFAGKKGKNKELSAAQKELEKNGWTVTKLELTAE